MCHLWQVRRNLLCWFLKMLGHLPSFKSDFQPVGYVIFAEVKNGYCRDWGDVSWHLVGWKHWTPSLLSARRDQRCRNCDAIRIILPNKLTCGARRVSAFFLFRGVCIIWILTSSSLFLFLLLLSSTSWRVYWSVFIVCECSCNLVQRGKIVKSWEPAWDQDLKPAPLPLPSQLTKHNKESCISCYDLPHTLAFSSNTFISSSRV